MVIGRRVEFGSYTATQLASILRKRVEQLRIDQAVSERQFKRVDVTAG